MDHSQADLPPRSGRTSATFKLTFDHLRADLALGFLASLPCPDSARGSLWHAQAWPRSRSNGKGEMGTE